MMHAVLIQETLQKKVWIDAETPAQAKEKVEDLYNQEELVLDWEDCIGVEFITTNEVKKY